MTAVVIQSLHEDKIVETTVESGITYSYEQEKEIISAAIYEAILQTIVTETTVSFDYSKVPENLVKILNEKGAFQCELINNDEDGKTVYKITPTGKGFYFILKMNNTSGEYDLTLGE